MTMKFRKTLFAGSMALASIGLAQAQTTGSPPILTPTLVPSGDGTSLDNPRPVTPQTLEPGTDADDGMSDDGMSQDRSDSSIGSMSPDSSRVFTRIDANLDGQLSRDEVKGEAGMSNKFKSMDSNQDGYVSMNEYSLAMSGSSKTNTRRSTLQ